jgi:hypothetical protein
MSYSTAVQPSTPASPDIEKYSKAPATPFAKFVIRLYPTKSERGAVIDLIQTLSRAKACPPINGWADLYRLLARRDASDKTILEARKLWFAFKASSSAAGRCGHE